MKEATQILFSKKQTNQIRGSQGRGGAGECGRDPKEAEETWGVMDMYVFIILNLAVVFWVCMYVRTLYALRMYTETVKEEIFLLWYFEVISFYLEGYMLRPSIKIAGVSVPHCLCFPWSFWHLSIGPEGKQETHISNLERIGFGNAFYIMTKCFFFFYKVGVNMADFH